MSEAYRPAAGGVVPIPNRLFDEVMAQLTDTELRVLLVVFRQTWGYREGADLGGWRYKRRDWLTHAQLRARTGRRSEAISRAIHSLVSAGLVSVEDRAGRPLATSEERRRHLGRLYFRPGDIWRYEPSVASSVAREPRVSTHQSA